MKRIVITFIECICFFPGWAILSAVLPLSNSDNPALWRLWAEITPLLLIIAFTWFVGFIEENDNKIYFAIYLDDVQSKEVVSGNKAKEIAISILNNEV